MSKNIVFEGWLTKSPPSKRIWKTKWRRRWFALRQSGELPGQYFLDYYADRNRRRLKGSINLDFCEQVDAGLHMERGSTDAIDPKLRGSVFTIQTQTRIYHLEADCEAEMTKWVDAICCVCGLKATDDNSDPSGIYQNSDVAKTNRENIELRVINQNRPRVVNSTTVNQSVSTEQENIITAEIEQQKPLLQNESNATPKPNEQNNSVESTGPYIPISECITGVRSQDIQNTFNFDPKNIVVSTKPQFEKPQIRINNVELSENESNFSEDECRSLTNSQSNIGEWTVAKTFTKMSLAQRPNAPSEEGPPVPPRPPKTLAIRDCQKELVNKPKILEVEIHENATHFTQTFPRNRTTPGTSHGTTPPSPGRSAMGHTIVRTTDDEDDSSVGHSMQYCNLSSLPPVVDRALKPRHSSHSIGNVIKLTEVVRRDNTLQYLDLDFSYNDSNSSNMIRRSANFIHGKSSYVDKDSDYKTVDFLKTEAFNITRQDAEASRSIQQ